MTRPSNFIPGSELTISPNSLISYMNKLFIEIFDDVLSYHDINIPEIIIEKSFKNKIRSSRIWQGILSSDRCMYIYTDNSKKCFTLCNKRILRDTNIDELINKKENKYFCSNHIRGQDISIRKRKFKDPNTKYCCRNNKNNNPCGNTAILAGNICKEHYKLDRGIKKHEKITIPDFLYIKNKPIDFSTTYWHEYRKSIEDYDKYTTTINNDVDSYYDKIISNFNTSENLFLKYLKPGHLARNKKYIKEIQPLKYSSLNLKNKSEEKILNSCSNSFPDNKYEQLNKSNSLDLLEQMENFKKRVDDNYTKINNIKNNIKENKYIKCEINGCFNCKKYDVIYYTYCKDHLFYNNNNIYKN
jgi:hypothetical protein